MEELILYLGFFVAWGFPLILIGGDALSRSEHTRKKLDSHGSIFNGPENF